MISSFFGKTKPINYIVLSVFLSLFYGFYLSYHLYNGGEAIVIPLEVLTIGVLLLMIFVINQIVKTEKVTDFSSYAMLFFVLLLVAFSDTLLDKNAVFASFFLLIAIWRLLAIKSTKNVKHKIFDASFLIYIASLFYEWALIFLIMVFVVINIYDRKTVKNWMVPIVAGATVFILVFTILKLYGTLSFFGEHYRFPLDFLDTSFFGQHGIVKLLIYTVLIILVASLVFLKVRKKGGGKLVPLRIVFLAFVLGIILCFFTFNESTPVLTTFFPAAVFLTNYLETVKRSRLREIAIAICVLIPFLLFVLELNR